MMSKTPPSLRPASAAIAAVLALSTTPVLAQQAMPATDPLAAPVIVPVDPPAPVAPPVDLAPSLPDALQPPVVTAPAMPDTAPNGSPPADVPTLEHPLPPVEPVPQTERSERPRLSTRAVPARPAAASATPAPAQVKVARDAAERAADLPLPTAATTTGAIAAPPDMPAEAVAIAARADSPAEGGLGEWALFGGLVGIGGIAAAAALSRRRRPEPGPEAGGPRLPHEIFPTSLSPAQPTEADGVAPGAPVVGASVATLARMNRKPVTGGKVGRYEAMVDAGPTPENPFLTRRKRLVRARFLDRQEAQSTDSRVTGWDDIRPRYAAR